MSFHLSSQNFRLSFEEGCTVFECEVRDRHGEFHHRKIKLDAHIGNTDGWFIWGGQNFTRTARDIRLEQTGNGPKLIATMQTNSGGDRGAQGLMLADKIENNDGHLRFTGA
ncbi:Cyanovirin-N [Aspergillus avenaceus]|uniref:Cyanovirin-N n=1 Tax=Aspergillus avenaceus TaxID=36643 RepID=A0A5N6TKZ8_ASPAV|nr:Cyanovirin-N [Aspergillus avenaceus]